MRRRYFAVRTYSVRGIATLFQQLNTNVTANTPLTRDGSQPARRILRRVVVRFGKRVCEGRLAHEPSTHYGIERAPECQHGDEGSRCCGQRIEGGTTRNGRKWQRMAHDHRRKERGEAPKRNVSVKPKNYDATTRKQRRQVKDRQGN